jgi:hypothetical protein
MKLAIAAIVLLAPRVALADEGGIGCRGPEARFALSGVSFFGAGLALFGALSLAPPRTVAAPPPPAADEPRRRDPFVAGLPRPTTTPVLSLSF